MTGADFSQPAIDLARSLAEELHLDATFVRSNVYDLPETLEGEFDVVYTSRGVLGWLPDVGAWAKVVAHFVKPGGLFYIHEVHPVTQVWEDENAAPGELRLRYPYFTNADPFEFDTQGSYADPTAEITTPKEYGWNHSMAEIVTGLASAGLHIELLREFPYTEWAYPFLEERRASAARPDRSQCDLVAPGRRRRRAPAVLRAPRDQTVVSIAPAGFRSPCAAPARTRSTRSST